VSGHSHHTLVIARNAEEATLLHALVDHAAVTVTHYGARPAATTVHHKVVVFNVEPSDFETHEELKDAQRWLEETGLISGGAQVTWL
jgi:hypothetical protein